MWHDGIIDVHIDLGLGSESDSLSVITDLQQYIHGQRAATSAEKMQHA